MEVFPTGSLLASLPVIVMLLLWYSESVTFFPPASFFVCLFVFLISTHFSFSRFHFLKEAAYIEALDILMVFIFLPFQSFILFPVEAKKASVLKLTLFRHECCGQNIPGICRQLKFNWKYMLCFR